MVIIDSAKCIGCGQCAPDCFNHNLKPVGGKMTVKRACMECGHCIAICPTEAISLDDYPAQPLYPYDPAAMQIAPENLLRFIQFRRSCRRFVDRKVERSKLALMLEAGRFTATGANLQDVSFSVIQDSLPQFKALCWESLHHVTAAAARGELAATDPTASNYARLWQRSYEKYQLDPANPENDAMFFNAPAVIVVKGRFAQHAELVASNVELMAYTQGLACLFTGFVRRSVLYGSKVQDFLGMDGKEFVLCMLVGYPAQTYRRTVPRKALQADWL
ncbi:MAG: nitroreductase family protein [Oscillospiraceae bacterium]|nr:nitroreductase family protein [Oscillospiraceae bacterium]